MRQTEAAARERALQIRLANALSNMGVGKDQVVQEVLGLMPHDFVVAYLELADRALDLSPSGTGKQLSAWADRGGKGGGDSGQGGDKSRSYVKDLKAVGQKKRIDRQLLRLAAQMNHPERQAMIRQVTGRMAGRCSNCKGHLQKGWKHCPKCGMPVTGKPPGQQPGA